MSQRYTITSVRAAFDLLIEEAARHGVDARGWRLEQPDMGYRVMATHPNGGRTDIPGFPGNGHVGMTAQEAAETLHSMRRGMEIARMNRG